MRVPWLVVPAVVDSCLSVPVSVALAWEAGWPALLLLVGSAASAAAIVLAHRDRCGAATRVLLVLGALTALFWCVFWLFAPPLSLLPAARVAVVLPLWRPAAPDGGALPLLPARTDG